jgi:GNAT superfamily N-acetyltransferase
MILDVRRAQPPDAETIAAFNAAMARETEHLELDTERVCAGVLAILRDENKGLYFVAEHEGRVVGQAMVTYEWSDWRNATFWWIQSVYVHQEYRGRGVFRRLFAHIQDASRAAGACGLRLYVERNNEAARRTYERLGMRRTPYDMYQVEYAPLETAAATP